MRVELTALAKQFQPVELPLEQRYTPSYYPDLPQCPVKLEQIEEVKRQLQDKLDKTNKEHEENESRFNQWVDSALKSAAPGYSGKLLTPESRK